MNKVSKGKGYVGLLEQLFKLGCGALNPDTVHNFIVFHEKTRIATNEALASLLPRYREAIEKSFGLECPCKTFAEIGADLGVTGGRIAQLIEKGVGQLRGNVAFDTLALELSDQNFTSIYIEIAVARAGSQSIVEDAKKRVLDSAYEEVSPGQFLIDHKLACSRDNPCPTCRALKLLEKHGIAQQIGDLLTEWRTNRSVDLLDLPINFVLPGLSTRTAHCLKNDNIQSLRKLLSMSEPELLRTPNFGRRSLNELLERLIPFGLTLK